MATKRDRLLPLGSTLAGLGGSLTVGYLIFSLQDPSRTFWQWPGILGLGVLAVSVLVLTAGLVAPVDKENDARKPAQIKQKQSGGRKSRNYQAGGDITIDPSTKKSR